MRAFLARNRLGPPLALLLAAAALALYAYFSLAAIPAQYQYLWAAPAPTAAATGGKAANDGLRDARLRAHAEWLVFTTDGVQAVCSDWHTAASSPQRSSTSPH